MPRLGAPGGHLLIMDFPAGQPSIGTARRPVRVMVVDDNADYRETLLEILDTDELEVVGEAGGGQESLEMAARLVPDIVLMDVRMPQMSGVETTRILKERHPAIEVVALTVHEEHAAVREMLAAGASGYVLKDDDGRNIVEAVRQAARTGGVLSADIAPTVIEELNEALERESRRAGELQVAHDEMAERIARRHELVSRLGHELRTPVSVIFGVARTLAAGDATEEEKQDLLERLVARTTTLMKLVERFESALDEEFTEPVGLHTLATELAEAFPRVRVAGDHNLPAVLLNPTLARRVLEELIDNALRFAPPESRIEVWVGNVGSHIKMKVMDRGPGIAQADRDRIFEPLEQAGSSDHRTHQGAGLGLSLARAAARAMGGDVELETSGPDGSTFVWTVPIDMRTMAD